MQIIIEDDGSMRVKLKKGEITAIETARRLTARLAAAFLKGQAKTRALAASELLAAIRKGARQNGVITDSYLGGEAQSIIRPLPEGGGSDG